MRPYRRPLLWTLLPLMLAGCGVFVSLPEEASISQRLGVLSQITPPPFDHEVHIHWSEHKIPYIIAKSDRDAAFALGLTHAHLRLGQMEVFKRVAAGRLSEMGGRRLTSLDIALRTVDFYRNSSAIVANMPDEPRLWLQAYVAGVNHYKDNLSEQPHEMVLGDISDEPWTASDTIAICRLTGSDVNWLAQASLLRLRDNSNWKQILAQLSAHRQEAPPYAPEDEPGAGSGAGGLEFFPEALRAAGLWSGNPLDLLADGSGAGSGELELFARTLRAVGRWGSNSLVISAERSASGAALIANEPHLGFAIPNLWLLAGVSSPGYQAVGMMIPGVPIIALGRNPHISWGGTNMRAYSSDIVELSTEPLVEIEHRILRRGSRVKRVKTRMSEIGPVISDLEIFEFPEDRDFALRWSGHLPTDELGAYLNVMRARNGREFKAALAGYATPGLYMLYAEKSGSIGQLTTAWLPQRPVEAPRDIWVSREDSDRWWQTMLTIDDLPSQINPDSGMIGSANNAPTADPPTRLAWSFPRDDRIIRMRELTAGRERWSLADLQSIHGDTYSRAHHRLNRQLIELARARELGESETSFVGILKGWDGHFDKDSKGAYAHIGLVEELVEELYDDLDREDEVAFWWGSSYLPRQLMLDLTTAEGIDAGELVEDAISSVDSLVDDGLRWGDVHRLKVGFFGVNLPVIGKRYLLYELPVGGGVETLMKSSHSLSADEHFAFYGSQSRHYSDMSDDDENYFVLYGGQDGWINSENFADQVPVWDRGEMIRLPLRAETIESQFPHQTRFGPADEQ